MHIPPSAFALTSSLCSSVFSCKSQRSDPFAESSWPGWQGLRYLFVFGDSYSTTGFNYTLAQPSSDNPLGNPDYPGYTSCNGPNWVDFLTTTYNESQLLTYNLAYGGATVDSALVQPYEPTVLSLKQQIQQEFLPAYSSKPDSTPWTASDALFALWIGINDVGNSYNQADATTSLQDAIFAEYTDLLEQLYSAGARNFLFLTVPPVERSPLTQNASIADPSAPADEKAAIAEWNGRLMDLEANLMDSHDDVVTFLFDTNALFSAALNDPTAFSQTAGYKNLTSYCPAYAEGTSTPTTLIPSCVYPVNEYFWLNSLHPTYPMHNLTAFEIARFLGGMPEIDGSDGFDGD